MQFDTTALQYIVQGFGLGMAVWVFSWGLNRIYLQVKSFLS